MKKRIYLMRRNWWVTWSLFSFPLHLCIKAAWNGFCLKGNTTVPWEGAEMRAANDRPYGDEGRTGNTRPYDGGEGD